MEGLGEKQEPEGRYVEVEDWGLEVFESGFDRTLDRSLVGAYLRTGLEAVGSIVFSSLFR